MVFTENIFAERTKEIGVVKYAKYDEGKRQSSATYLAKAIKEVSSYESDLVSVDIFLEANAEKRAAYKRIIIPNVACTFTPEMYEGMREYVKNGGLLITNSSLLIIDNDKTYKRRSKGETFWKPCFDLIGVRGTGSTSMSKIKVEVACPLTEGLPVGEWITLETKVGGRKTVGHSATVLITTERPSGYNQPFLAFKHTGKGACIYIVPPYGNIPLPSKDKYILLKNALSKKTLEWLTLGE